MKLLEIVNVLDAEVLTGSQFLDVSLEKVRASDLMSDILAALSEDFVLLTGLTTIHTIRTAQVAGIGAVVFVRNKKPPVEVVQMAAEQDLPLLATPYSMFVSSGRLYTAGLKGLSVAC